MCFRTKIAPTLLPGAKKPLFPLIGTCLLLILQQTRPCTAINSCAYDDNNNTLPCDRNVYGDLSSYACMTSNFRAYFPVYDQKWASYSMGYLDMKTGIIECVMDELTGTKNSTCFELPGYEHPRVWETLNKCQAYLQFHSGHKLRGAGCWEEKIWLCYCTEEDHCNKNLTQPPPARLVGHCRVEVVKIEEDQSEEEDEEDKSTRGAGDLMLVGTLVLGALMVERF